MKKLVGGPDKRILTDNKITNACRLMQPVVIIREKRNEACTITAMNETDHMTETHKMEAGNSS